MKMSCACAMMSVFEFEIIDDFYTLYCSVLICFSKGAQHSLAGQLKTQVVERQEIGLGAKDVFYQI